MPSVATRGHARGCAARGVLVMGPGESRASGVLLPSYTAAEQALGLLRARDTPEPRGSPITSTRKDYIASPWDSCLGEVASNLEEKPFKKLVCDDLQSPTIALNDSLCPSTMDSNGCERTLSSCASRSVSDEISTVHENRLLCREAPRILPNRSICSPRYTFRESVSVEAGPTSTASVETDAYAAVRDLRWPPSGGGGDGGGCGGGGESEGAWVLTVGSALGTTLLQRLQPGDLPVGRLLLPTAARRPRPSFAVICEATQFSRSVARCDACGERHVDGGAPGAGDVHNRRVPAVLAGVWRCALLSRAVDHLLREFVLLGEDANQETSQGLAGGQSEGENDAATLALSRAALPVLAVLRVGPGAANHTSEQLLKGASEVLCSVLRRLERNGVAGGGEGGGGAWWRGRRLLLEASPFGSGIFLNSWSVGVAGGAAGPRNCVLLADASAAPGCEGAPAFLTCAHAATGNPRELEGRVAPRRKLGPVALTIVPVCWWRGEWVGFTLLASLPPVLRALFPHYPTPTTTPTLTNVAPSSVAPPAKGTLSTFAVSGESDAMAVTAAGVAAEAGLVLVRCGAEWGSGVVVALPPDPVRANGTTPAKSLPLVLTCAHVVRNAPEPGSDEAEESEEGGAWGRVGVSWRGRRLRCRLLFRAPPSVAFDVALIQLLSSELEEDLPTPLVLSASPAAKGERVLSAGFPLLGDARETNGNDGGGGGPLVSVGRIAKSSPALLHAACLAQSGASGGALLRPTGVSAMAGAEVVGVVVSNVRDALNGALFPHLCMAAPVTALLPPLLAFAHSGDPQVLKDLVQNDEATQHIWLLKDPPLINSNTLKARL